MPKIPDRFQQLPTRAILAGFAAKTLALQTSAFSSIKDGQGGEI
jgi:hypothetical protein